MVSREILPIWPGGTLPGTKIPERPGCAWRNKKEKEKDVVSMAAKSGSLSINSENIFPIIKKWLYNDHDIFYRELISNGCDAITKLKKDRKSVV